MSFSVIHEDQWLIVVNKPAGLLSQPGRTEPDSLVTQVLEAYPDITGPALVHRLDMDTSGLIILARSRSIHRAAQQLFENRKVGKRYTARLQSAPTAMGGRIDLPLRLDVDRRPRQIVCREHGRASVTLWRRADTANRCDVQFFPLTGRTHQLRVHAAHLHGLHNAIQGDRLYGTVAGRLMLHADYLAFEHPATGCRLTLHSPAPFDHQTGSTS